MNSATFAKHLCVYFVLAFLAASVRIVQASSPVPKLVSALLVGTAPVANGDSETTVQDVPVIVDVVANDTDVDTDIDSGTVAIVDAANNGQTSVDPASGEITYQPNPGFIGSDTFTYNIADLQGNVSNPATVSLTVNATPPNTLPVAVDDSDTTDEDTAVIIDVLANDTDADGSIDAASVVISSAATSGATSVNPATGAVTYTPNANFNGGDSFTYTVDDDEGATSNAATVTITVNDINDKPTAVNDEVTTFVDISVDVDVLANDSDSDGTLDPNTLTVEVPSTGSISISPSGVFNYTPNQGFVGTDTFTYSVRDDDGRKSNNATVTINVVSPPDAVNDAAQTNEDQSVSIDVLANDTDLDGTVDPTTVAIVNAPVSGIASVDGSGAIVYTPDTDFFGDDSLTYSVQDDDGNTSDTASVLIEVFSINDAPVANRDSGAVLEDNGIAVTVLSNDVDIDGSLIPATVTIVDFPSNGSGSVNGAGQLVYIPNQNFFGLDTLTYHADDDSGAVSNDTLVVINVIAVNDLPVALADTAATDEDVAVAIDVLSNDSDIDGSLDASTVSVTAAPAHGGTSINAATGEITYTPDINFFGKDSLEYTVNDNDGGTSLAARVRITVNDINDAPVAVNDTIITSLNTAADIDVLANDSDVDGSIVTSTLAATSPSNGTTTLEPSGTIVYTPDNGFEGVDSFIYFVRDDDGGSSNTATVTVIVTAPPLAVNDTVSTVEGSAIIIDVTANDSDSDGLDLSSVAVTNAPGNGAATVNPANGEITYTPVANFSGLDQIDYTVDDTYGVTSNQATIFITVSEDNDVPVANDDSATTPEDTPAVVDILANDFDVEAGLDPGSVNIISGPSQGGVTVNAGNGALTYTPAPDFFGADTVRYTVDDNLGASSDTALVILTVSSVNDSPVAVRDTAQTLEDNSAVVDVPANDSDVDGSLVLSAVLVTSSAQHGGTTVNPATGVISYSPDSNFFGADSFKYTIEDNDGALSQQTTVLIEVASENDRPVAVDDADNTIEETPVEIVVLVNDSDIDGSLIPATVVVTGSPSNGTTSVNGATGTITYEPALNFSGLDTLTYSVDDNDGATSNIAEVVITVAEQSDKPIAVDDNAQTDEDTPVAIDVTSNDISFDVALDLSSVTVVMSPAHGGTATNPATGVITYTPDAHFFGDDSLHYTVANGSADVSDPATVTITVNPVNDTPVALADSATTPEDTPVVLDILANDSDVEGPLNAASVAIRRTPVHGTTSINPSTGAITYSPDINFFGKDTLEYDVEDGAGRESNTARVVVTTADVNDPPVAVADSVSTMFNTPVDIDVLVNDFDLDGTIDSNSIEVGLATNGTAAINSSGLLTYTPNPGFGGIDSFIYTVRDDDGSKSNVAIVKIRVGIVPVAVNDAFSAVEDVVSTFAILENDNDPDGDLDSTSVRIVTPPDSGSLSINPVSGKVTYTPLVNFFGSVSFVYEVDDLGGNTSNQATATISVASDNDSPIAAADAETTLEDTPVSVDVLTNDSDVDGSLIASTVTVTDAPSNGIAAPQPGGTILYTPAPDFFGTDTLKYTVDDDSASVSNSASVFISITSDNDSPLAVADSYSINEDVGTVILDVLDNDSDVDGSLDVTSVALTLSPAHGTANVNAATGDIDYAADADFFGTDSLRYTVLDNLGAVSTPAVVIVTISDINDPPIAANDSVITAEDTPISMDVTLNDTDIDGTVDKQTLAITQASDGTNTLKPDGTITYAPDPGFTGSDLFTYTVRDDDGAQSNSATTVIIVTDRPAVVDDIVATNEGQPVDIDVTQNDSDSNGLDLSSLAVVEDAKNGTTSVNGSTGEITYTPSTNFSGDDSLRYTIDDSLGVTSEQARVLITVTEDNDIPVANDDAASTPEDTPVVIDVLANDVDVEGSLVPASVAIVSGPLSGTHSIDPATGAITYTPGLNFFGSDSLSYTVDDAAAATSNTAVVRITVSSSNDLPVAGPDVAQTDEDLSIDIDVLMNDSDADGSLIPASVTVAAAPAHGATAVNPTTGAITYTPDPNFFGPDNLEYTVQDNDGGTSPQTLVTITVDSLNDAPVALDNSASTGEDNPVTIDILNNDSDVDGEIDTSSVALILLPDDGSFSVSSNTGSITYSPAQDFFGNDTLTYTVKDKQDLTSNEATVIVQVIAQSDKPVAVDDAEQTDEDTPLDINVTANDVSFDVDLDLTSVIVEVSPVNGTATVNPSTGVITYSPGSNYSGSDSLRYSVANLSAERSEPASLRITVNPINDPPIAEDDGGATAEDSPVVISVLANDSDVDGTLDPASVTILVAPLNGGTAINTGSGAITYTPDADFFGDDTLKYSVRDDQAAESDTAVVLVSVSGVNDPPVAVDDSAATFLNTAVDIQILANDIDVDGTLVINSITITQARHGTAAIDPAGVLTYTPDNGFGGLDTLTYTVRDDDNALSNEALVTIRVGSSPIASDDQLTIPEDTPGTVDVLANDSDPDGTIDVTTVAITNAPANGSVSVDPVSGLVTYSPDQDFSGGDSFSYSVQDDESNTSNGASVSVTIAEINDAPVAVNDPVVTLEDIGIAIEILNNDTDVDGSLVENTIALTDSSNHGAAIINATTGEIVYTPDANFFGLDSLFYTVDDDSGATSNSALVVVTVDPDNDAPIAVNDTVSTSEDGQLIFGVAANDTDIDGSIVATTVIVTDAPRFGAVSVDNATGDITYTPAPDSSGVDTLRYTVEDNDGGISNPGVVFVNVAERNDPPIAVNDTTVTTLDVPIDIPVTLNDIDIDGVIDTSSLFATQAANGTTTLNIDGSITYSPNSGFSGLDVFTYNVKDDSAATSNLATVFVTVTAAPVAVDDITTVLEGQNVVIDVPDNDSDPDGSLDLTSVNVVSGPENGAAVVDPVTGEITYTPALNYSGLDSLFYTIADDLGQVSNQAKVSITVDVFNDAPVAVDDTATTVKNVPHEIAVLDNDSDVDGTLVVASVTIVSPALNGSSNVSAGVITYTSSPAYFGKDSLQYTVADNDGKVSDPATVRITVNDQNIAPVALPDAFTTDEDVAVVMDVLTNDNDPDGTLSFISIVVNPNPDNGTPVLDVNTGTLTYTPNSDFFGEDSLEYSVQDNLNLPSNTVKVNITVNPLNDAPAALDDNATTPEDASVVVDVLANDTDVDDTIDATSVAIADTAKHGDAVVNPATGEITYTPDANFAGDDSLTYEVSDLVGASDTATVYVNVGEANDPPVAVDDSVGTTVGLAVTITILDNDIDVDGSIESATLEVGPASSGIPSIATNGVITYTPNANFNGIDQFTYTVKDDDGAESNIATVTVRVGVIPDANDDIVPATEDAAVVADILANDTDLDGTIDSTSVAVTSPPDSGSFAIDGVTGKLTYTPNPDFFGEDTLKYTVQDDDGNVSAVATIFITVASVNDDPIAANDTTTTPEDTPLTFDVTTNDVDIDGAIAPLTVQTAGVPTNGIATVNPATGLITFNPNQDFSGAASVPYTVEDNSGGISNTAILVIEVLAQNDAPVAGNDAATTDEDVSLVIDPLPNDSDPDGALDSTSVAVTTQPLHGIAVADAITGEIAYSPALEFSGQDSLKYTVRDTAGLASSPATIVISVLAVNDPPLAVNDTTTTPQAAAVSFNVLDNDSDVDGTVDVNTVTVTRQPLNGSLIQGSAGAMTYTPDAPFNGVELIQYEVSDNLGLASNTANVLISVGGSGGSQTLTFLPVHDGQVKLTDGSKNYGVKATAKVESGSFATYFKFDVAGVNGPISSVKLRLTVASGSSDGSDSGGRLFSTSNSFDGSSEPWLESSLTSSNAPGPSGGVIASVGQVAPLEQVTFNLAGAITGDGTFSFCLTSESGNRVKYYTKEGAAPPQLVISTGFGGSNSTPVAINDVATTLVNTPVAVDVSANDSDSDGTLDLNTVTVVAFPSDGTVTVNGATGEVTYTPDAAFEGTDSFSYTVDDNEGATSNVALVNLTVAAAGGGGTLAFAPTDDGQVKVSEPAKNYGGKGTTKVEDGKFVSYFKFVVAGVSAPVQSATLRLRVSDGTSDGGSTGGSAFAVSNEFSTSASPWNEGALTSGNAPAVAGAPLATLGPVAPNQAVAFDVTGAISGNGVVSFAITSTSGNQVKYYTKEGSVSPQLEVNTGSGGSNLPPVAVDDNAATQPGLPVIIDVAANDSDSDGSVDPGTVSVLTPPASGSISNVSLLTGAVTYQPNLGFSGLDTFTYSILDNDVATSNTATVTVTVGGGNIPPVAVNDAANAFEGTPITIDVSSNDSDSDGTIDLSTVAITTPPGDGSVSIGSFGTIIYTPNAGFSGSDTFGYTIQDDDAAPSNEATVTVMVQSSGGSSSQTFVAVEDGQVKLTAPANNYGAKATTKVEAAKFSSYFKFVVSGVTGAVQSAKLRLKVTDGSSDGGDNGGSVFLVGNDFAGTSTPWTEGLLTSGNAPATGGSALSSVGAVATTGVVEFDITGAGIANGIFSFAIVGSSTNQVKYFTKEGLVPPSLVVSVSGGGGNNAPIAVDDNVATAQNTAIAVTVTANDTDSDGTIDVTTVAVISQPANGSTAVNGGTGAVTYTPGNGFSGTDSFTYRVVDDDGANSNVATVNVTVGGSNISPVAQDDVASAFTGSPALIDVTANDSDSDGSLNVNSVTVTAQPSDGTAVAGASGVITYTPATGFSGADSFAYTVQDNLGSVSNIATVTVNVAGGGMDTFTFSPSHDAHVKPNSPGTNDGTRGTLKVENGLFVTYLKFEVIDLTGPVQSAKLRMRVTPDVDDGSDSAGSIFLASNNFDASSQPWTETQVTASNAPPTTSGVLDSPGAVSENTTVEFDVLGGITGNGIFSFCITTQSNDQVKYFAREGDVPPQLVIRAVTAGGGNVAPVASDDNATTVEGAAVVVNVLANDSDSDGSVDPATVTVQSNPGNGATSVDGASGTVTYTPNSGFTGADSFGYTVQDDDGATSNIATVSVSVSPLGSTTTLTFTSTDDGQVKVTAPGSNYGVKATAKVTSNKFQSYFKFNVNGVSGPILSAKLRLRVALEVEAASENGGSVFKTSNNFSDGGGSWTEGALNFANAPDVLGTAINTLGPVQPNTLVEVDVSGSILGNGQISYALISSSTDEAKYFTRNSTFPPELVLTTTSGAVSARGGENLAPLAVPDMAATKPGESVEVDVLSNDSDGDGFLKHASVAAVTSPAHGTVRLNAKTGALLYTAAAGFKGRDSFNYTVEDNEGRISMPASVTIVVSESGHLAPVARDDAAETYAGVSIQVPVLLNDSAFSGKLVSGSIVIESPASHGTVDVNLRTGAVRYLPDNEFRGFDEFTYSVQDGSGQPSTQATVRVSVQPLQPQTLSFLPTDDAFVRSSRPTDNFGSSYELRATNGKAEFYSFLKFEVVRLTAPIVKATLRLYVFDDNEGGNVYSVSNNYRGSELPWQETGLVWDNAPVIEGAPANSFTGAGPGQTIEIDLTQAVHDEGFFSFGLSSHSPDAGKYESKEASNPPVLVVETGEVVILGDPDETADKGGSPPLLPTEIRLHANYPNPFNAGTTISYDLPADAKVKLDIYNIRGQVVRTLIDQPQTAGVKRMQWFGKNDNGLEVGSGVYFMRLEVGQKRFSRRIVLQK